MGELYNPYPRLPKNVRQIGERDTTVKLYMEDYVNTYLKRLYPTVGQDLRVGLLLGDIQMQDGVPFIFVDGAMEMEDVPGGGETVAFTESGWKKAYQAIEQMFPKRGVMGWFLCGAQGSTLSPLNYWKQHGQYFSGKNQLMYLNSGLEGEESVYITSDDGFYKLRGHTIYYERNQMMQDYMVHRKDARRVETGTKDNVIQDFRQRMESKRSEIRSRGSVVNTLGTVCAALAVAVLAGGVVLFNNYAKMREMESVIASALPAEYAQEWLGGKKGTESTGSGTQIEEVPGGVSTAGAVSYGQGEQPLPEYMPGGNSTAGGNGMAGDGMAGGNGVAGGNGMASGNGAAGESGMASGNGTAGGNNAASGGAGGSGLADGSGTPGAAGDPVVLPAPPAETVSAEEAERIAAMAATATVYEVQPGETLYGICLQHYQDLSRVRDVCLINGLESQDKIVAGQKLLLP